MFPFIARAKILYVHEPSVYEVLLDLGFELTFKRTVYLKDVSLPSTRSMDADDRERAYRAKRCAIKALKNRWVMIETFKERSSRPAQWPAKILVDGKTRFTDVEVDVCGQKLVDMGKYMTHLAAADFEESVADMRSPNYEDTSKSH